jgi:hypothetical protein
MDEYSYGLISLTKNPYDNTVMSNWQLSDGKLLFKDQKCNLREAMSNSENCNIDKKNNDVNSDSQGN